MGGRVFAADPTSHGQDFAAVRLAGAGDLRRHAAFRSRFLGAARDVTVYLPPRYEEEAGRRYPVVYLQDGQNLFDGATSFIPGQDWRAGQTAEALIRAREVEPFIIVGVNHAGRERADEYTPTFDARLRAGGKASLYGRLLVEELKPFVDARYRTLGGPAHTGLGGSSLGGLVSLYLGLWYPEVFGRLAVMSPSVWWGGGAVLREVSALAARPATRVWLDMGTAEGRRALGDARRLRDALRRKGWRLGEDLNYFEAAGAGHTEGAWAARLGPALKYLFPPA